MVGIFAFIDFQCVFSPEQNTSWCVPKFNQALQTAMLTCEKLKPNCVPIATAYIPPNDIKGIWKTYFDKYPDIPRNPCNKIFDIDSSISGIDKLRYAGFSKWKSLAKIFKHELEHDPENILYLCGVATDCCVLSTALEAVESGIKVCIIKDGCASGDDATHERALKIMEGYSPNIEIKDSSMF